MLTALLAAGGWLGVGWAPGYAMADLARPGSGRLRNATLAPLLGLGLTMIVAQIVYVLGLRIDPWTVLPFSVGLPLSVWVITSAQVRRAETSRERTRAG